jgi:cysteine dioxygenase
MSQTTSEQYPIFERENTDKPIAGGLLKDLVVKLREIFESDDINVEEVKILIESYKSNPADWEKFAQFDPHR